MDGSFYDFAATGDRRPASGAEPAGKEEMVRTAGGSPGQRLGLRMDQTWGEAHFFSQSHAQFEPRDGLCCAHMKDAGRAAAVQQLQQETESISRFELGVRLA